MSHLRLAPPKPEDCLIWSRASSCKGGTLIAEDVTDLATHQRRLSSPDGYRLDHCPQCGGKGLHVHDYVERKPLDLPGTPVRVVRYICTLATCRATWRILPAFLARHLWRTWSAIEQTVLRDEPGPPPGPPVPKRTARRWRSRLTSSARQLVALLASSGGAVLEASAKAVGLDGTRGELVAAHQAAAGSRVGQWLAELAAVVHRLERGLRLM